MIHPFAGNLSDLKDIEVEQRLAELTKKYFQAQRFGNQELLTQVDTFVKIYRNELAERHRQTMKNSANDIEKGDLDQLINVEK